MVAKMNSSSSPLSTSSSTSTWGRVCGSLWACLLSIGVLFATGCSARVGADYDELDLGLEDFSIRRNGDFAVPCVGLICQRPRCSGINTTTLSGTVFAPNGMDPLYNVLVFVPGGKPLDFEDGVSCETCEKSVTGYPITAALTDHKGHFVLKDMPAGQDIPLVMQIGRFRRQIVIPSVTACADTEVAKADSRLPRNRTEGDIPKIAIVTSTYDPTECILNAIGIDANEFTAPSGTGRIHIYHGSGNNIAGAPSGESLWGDLTTLKKYQMVAMPCGSYPSGGAGVQNLFDYANAGGRLFITDLSYPVISQGKGDWPSTGDFGNPGSFVNKAKIETTGFPKGQALKDWMEGIGAAMAGELTLMETYSRVGAIKPPAQRWLYSSMGTNTQSYTFNTPTNVPEKDQCGRVFYSSFHIGSGRSFTGTFPGACQNKPLTAQERVLEFMLFDLTSCVMSDQQPPVIP